ncbi:MAG: hypothetical protein LBK04_01725 [Clostridiales Family XIII bacterium]|nr:hypothetical protein [Clostridiales Family XIII bacterium]
MRNKFCLCGLLGIVGVIGGAVLGSRTLWAFALFFPLLLLLRVEKGEAFSKMLYRCCIRTLVFGLASFSGVMFIGAILTQSDFIRQQMPFDMLALLYGVSLSLCFALTIAAFVGQTLAGAALLQRKRLRG